MKLPPRFKKTRKISKVLSKKKRYAEPQTESKRKKSATSAKSTEMPQSGLSPKKRHAPRVPERKPRVLPPSTLKPGQERLERYLAHAGLASRREAKQLIASGDVLVNGKKVREPGFGIYPDRDKVSVASGTLEAKETVLLYKPRGVETNATNEDASDIRKRYPHLAHLSPIGRLDKDSEGLILLSNDGTLARALTQEQSHVEKEYLVTVREEVNDNQLRRMADGIVLDGVPTKPAILQRRGRSVFSITLTEGRKHQIRRMADACRLTITSLIRIRIGHLKAGKMMAGNVKSVAPSDVEKLKQR